MSCSGGVQPLPLFLLGRGNLVSGLSVLSTGWWEPGHTPCSGASLGSDTEIGVPPLMLRDSAHIPLFPSNITPPPEPHPCPRSQHVLGNLHLLLFVLLGLSAPFVLHQTLLTVRLCLLASFTRQHWHGYSLWECIFAKCLVGANCSLSELLMCWREQEATLVIAAVPKGRALQGCALVLVAMPILCQAGCAEFPCHRPVPLDHLTIDLCSGTILPWLQTLMVSALPRCPLLKCI